MKSLLVCFVLLIVSDVASADAGFLNSITQNPVPAGFGISHPFISMTCEDVFIEVFPDEPAELTAAFLFTNTGPADTVVMYFPITVRTVTTGPGLPLWQVIDPMGNPEVKVNGVPVDVHPLIGNTWYPEYLDYTWEELREAVTTIVEAEPDTGETFHYSVAPECWNIYDFWELTANAWASRTLTDELMILIQSLNACWTVPFGKGEEVLVEYCLAYSLSSPYEGSYSTLTYPLYTGASWNGPIGSGRITVVPSGEMDFRDFVEWHSVSMPEAEVAIGMEFSPLSEIADATGYKFCRISELAGMNLDSILIWEFTDFEPVVSRSWSRYFHFAPGPLDQRFYDGGLRYDSTGWASTLRVHVQKGS
ncbi:MAG: hypothetical protein K8S62_02185 [Candidatus Sabulitectum sp.]|nr:hypothetical protein [Candidatus Sabulitectum sp.]